MKHNIQLSPSILAADFTRLHEEIESVNALGAEMLHIDVMDGHFVPNISIGVPVVQSIRKATDMFLDCHLMIDRPIRYIQAFCKAGADMIVIHEEADTPEQIDKTLDQIHALDVKAGLSIKPNTPADVLLPYLLKLDMILIMTVEPGFGGQSFMHDQLEKIRTVREMINRHKPDCLLQVDGGINEETAKLSIHAGANVLVAGSAIFQSNDREKAMHLLRQA